MFVLDSAGTVHAERWHYMLDFVEWIVERLDVGSDRTRVAVVYWSDSAYVGFTLDRYFVRQVPAPLRLDLFVSIRLLSSHSTAPTPTSSRRSSRRSFHKVTVNIKVAQFFFTHSVYATITHPYLNKLKPTTL